MSNTMALWSKTVEVDRLSSGGLVGSIEALLGTTVVALIRNVLSSSLQKVLRPLESILVHLHAILIDVVSLGWNNR
jgi:hypothetical protein